MFSYSAKKYSSNKCLGVRPILGESNTTSNGMTHDSFNFENCYTWNTFKEVERRVINISDGLSLGTNLNARDNIIIYAETCMDWFVTAMACFRNNYTIASLYTNLGTEGIQ